MLYVCIEFNRLFDAWFPVLILRVYHVKCWSEKNPEFKGWIQRNRKIYYNFKNILYVWLTKRKDNFTADNDFENPGKLHFREEMSLGGPNSGNWRHRHHRKIMSNFKVILHGIKGTQKTTFTHSAVIDFENLKKKSAFSARPTYCRSAKPNRKNIFTTANL